MKKLSLTEMEKTKGGMPCWMAKSLLIGAGVSFAFFTGGWGTLIFHGVLVAGAEYGLLESCFPELMN